MKKLLFILLIASNTALASDYYEPEPGGNATAVGIGVGIGIAGAHAQGGNASAEGGNAISVIHDNTAQQQAQDQLQVQTAHNEGNDQQAINKVQFNDNSLYEAQKRDPVSSAITSGLTTGGDDVCLGSKTLALQAVGIGLSGGSTVQDDNCIFMKRTKLLVMRGYDKAADALMCTVPEMVGPLKAQGIDCNALLGKKTNESISGESISQSMDKEELAWFDNL